MTGITPNSAKNLRRIALMRAGGWPWQEIGHKLHMSTEGARTYSVHYKVLLQVLVDQAIAAGTAIPPPPLRPGKSRRPNRRPANNADGPWTDDLVAQLQVLWAEGHSTAAIGRRLNVSKNAVVGKAHRLDLPSRPSPIRRE